MSFYGFRVFSNCYRYRVTLLLAVPSTIYQMVNAPELQTTDLSSLTAIGCGTAYLPQKLSKKFMAMLPRNVDMIKGQDYVFFCP